MWVSHHIIRELAQERVERVNREAAEVREPNATQQLPARGPERKRRRLFPIPRSQER
jgi:hypothetical protein